MSIGIYAYTSCDVQFSIKRHFCPFSPLSSQRSNYVGAITLSIIIGVFGQVSCLANFLPRPRLFNNHSPAHPYMQLNIRSPKPRYGRVTVWRQESSPQTADRRVRDRLPRPLGPNNVVRTFHDARYDTVYLPAYSRRF